MDILWIDLMKPVWKIWIDDHPKSCMAGFLCLSNPTADAVAEEKPAGSAVPVKCDLNDLNGYIIYHNIAAVVEAPYPNKHGGCWHGGATNSLKTAITHALRMERPPGRQEHLSPPQTPHSELQHTSWTKLSLGIFWTFLKPQQKGGFDHCLIHLD